MVEAGDGFCGLNRVALRHKTDPGRDPQRGCHDGGGCQRHKWVHDVVVLLRQVAALRELRQPGRGYMAVLGRPERIESAFFQRLSQVRSGHGIRRAEHRDTNFHTLISSFNI